jgi:hypothetical protein
MKPFDDVGSAGDQVRHQRGIVTQILQNTGSVAHTVVSGHEWAYNPDALKLPYDPSQAIACRSGLRMV